MTAPVFAADRSFDPGRYAFELFSEDEITLSEYAGDLPEEEVSALLEASWKKLDEAAGKTRGMDETSARAAIQNAVRGENGVADAFRRDISRKAEAHSGNLSARAAEAARHPVVWAVVALFVVTLVVLNRRST